MESDKFFASLLHCGLFIDGFFVSDLSESLFCFGTTSSLKEARKGPKENKHVFFLHNTKIAMEHHQFFGDTSSFMVGKSPASHVSNEKHLVLKCF